MTQCDFSEILKQMQAIETLKDIRFGLGDCQLGTALDELITKQESECERLAGECGSSLPEELIPGEDIPVLDAAEELFPADEDIDAELTTVLSADDRIEE